MADEQTPRNPSSEAEKLLRSKIEYVNREVTQIRDKIATLGVYPDEVRAIDSLLHEMFERKTHPADVLGQARRIEAEIDVGLR